MIGFRKIQGFAKRFVNTAVSTNITVDTNTGSLKENSISPQITDFDPLVTSMEVQANVGNIIEEYKQAQMEGKLVPPEISLEVMQELLMLESRSQRLKYLTYKFKKDRIKINAENKRKARLVEKTLNSKEKATTLNDHIEYGIGKTSLFVRMNKHSFRKYYFLRQAYAALFGLSIVVDLDYEEYMLRREVRNLASQLAMSLSTNRRNRYPYNVYLCNAKASSFSMECLKEHYPLLNGTNDFVHCAESSYLDIFPKERLVYLSPHADEALQHYDPTAIYIIGAFVDTSKQYKVSNKKAEKEGIKSYALPLNEHIMWGYGGKSLSINQVFEIMLEMKNTRNWRKALEKFVPTRKIKRLDEENLTSIKLPDKMFLIDRSKKK